MIHIRVRRAVIRYDDPRSWAALANGYRIAGLRDPIETAIRQVGPSRVRQLVREHPGAWPDGLEQFLERAVRESTYRGSGGALAQQAATYDDYGTRPD